jgi:hypothetical protein
MIVGWPGQFQELVLVCVVDDDAYLHAIGIYALAHLYSRRGD